MKSFMITATIVAMVALCAACQSEPEVGDALYPQMEETYGPHAYINETAAPGNAACLQLVQTPVELLLPDQNVSFKVRLTQPAETDVTVNLAEDPEAARLYDPEATPLPAGTFTLSTAKLTIPRGALESSQACTVTIASQDALLDFGTRAVAAISMVSSDGAPIGNDHNAYYLSFSKIVTNYMGQDYGTLQQRVQHDPSDFTLQMNGEDVTNILTDGSPDTDVLGYGEFSIVAAFESPQPLSGLVFYAGTYYPSYYSPRYIELFTSDDGVNWTSQTGDYVDNAIVPHNATTPVPLTLYSSVSCRYVCLTVYDSFYWGYSYISELKLFK
ncbi:MAG: DUF1735 domain-containing protein [Prevotella sp.]